MSKKEIQSLKERNRRVELDKAWETSATRRAIIAVLTYFVIVVFLYSIHVSNPWLNALVPCLGYLLSTLSMPFFKRYWARKVYSRRKL